MSKAPIVPGIQDIRGNFRINGAQARLGQIVRPGDVALSGPDGSATIIIMDHVFMIRENSEIEFYPDYFTENEQHGVSGTLKIISGAMLAVFGTPAKTTVSTRFASIGIRGTGVYVDSRPDRSYVCICYGRADLSSIQTGQFLETVTTRHHESPRYIYPAKASTQIEKAPVIDHTDAELRILEALVHRIPPFDTGNINRQDEY